MNGRTARAHRALYEHYVGLIPKGLQIDHLCRNPRCVNPSHMEPVTSRENTMRSDGVTARKARQSHCLNGHELTEANTFRRKDRPGRECRACRAARHRTRVK